ncbi:NucA/NucB deoxyribonuclease domain-containing protein [Bacillus haynesii]|uniref:NucA/NucB deoxyribonuclease domain-containing protein n=1 Tax=Bacillus haynesii TaxID=1925021 RepID=UPI002DC008EF|nr:NucA/NucB deoxyribonuclease domain-containing protein [Bacillus haynesii]MEC1345784.1 NucA/NucB deoxyribonuclease domain-containing protein [Bacillus haynesii]MEC1475724.1 NucA/NucB deoxyribonuclease domain-containing protein [Bacillus haynesii]
MDNIKSLLITLLAVAVVIIGIISGDFFTSEHQPSGRQNDSDYDEVLIFPSERYPETGAHIRKAIKKGHSEICTIDRDGADERRKDSLKDVPSKSGYDRDEWPMAMCEEGGTGASVDYISPSDNRGAGSWVGNQVSDYPDGTKVLFKIK